MKKLIKIIATILVVITSLSIASCGSLSRSEQIKQVITENPSEGLDLYTYDWLPGLTFKDLVESTIDEPEYSVNITDPETIKIYASGFCFDTIPSGDIFDVKLEYHMTNNGESLSLNSIEVDDEIMEGDETFRFIDIMACMAIHEKYGSMEKYLNNSNAKEKMDESIINGLTELYDVLYVYENDLSEASLDASDTSLSQLSGDIYGVVDEGIEIKGTKDKSFCIKFLNQYEMIGFEYIPFGNVVDKFLSVNSTWEISKDPESEDYRILIQGESNYDTEYFEPGKYSLELAYRAEENTIDLYYIQLPDYTGLDPYTFGYEPFIFTMVDNYCTSMGSSFDEYTDYLAEKENNEYYKSAKYSEVRDAFEYLDTYQLDDTFNDYDESTGISNDQSSNFISPYSNNIGDQNLVGRWRDSYDGHSLSIDGNGVVKSDMNSIVYPYLGMRPDTVLCQSNGNGRITFKYIYAGTVEYDIRSVDLYEGPKDQIKMTHVQGGNGNTIIYTDGLYKVSGEQGSLIGSWGEVEYTKGFIFNSDGTGEYRIDRETKMPLKWISEGNNVIYIEIYDTRTVNLDYKLYGDMLEIFFNNGSVYFERVGY